MSRTSAILSKALVFALPLCTAVALTAAGDAHAQEVVVAPPSIVVQTAHPDYYAGHHVYWHDAHWYYRAGNRWNYYRVEPRYLHEHRAHWANDHRHDHR